MIVGQFVEQQKAQVGGIKALDCEYEHNKPIEFNETAYFPMWYHQADKISNSRVEAWEFFVGGGASFNQVNALFTIADPAGDTPENAQILGNLARLRGILRELYPCANASGQIFREEAPAQGRFLPRHRASRVSSMRCTCITAGSTMAPILPRKTTKCTDSLSARIGCAGCLTS